MDNYEIFQSVEKPRLADEVARQITQAIHEGRFLPGQALPPARELATKFNVSRILVKMFLRYKDLSLSVMEEAFVKDPDTIY
jgi:DNA-binding GntR family transcriptional regulator